MPKGYVTKLNGKPLTMWLTIFQLGDCRKLFRYRAACHGVTPTPVEIDDALWLCLETGELPYLYSGEKTGKIGEGVTDRSVGVCADETGKGATLKRWRKSSRPVFIARDGAESQGASRLRLARSHGKRNRGSRRRGLLARPSRTLPKMAGERSGSSKLKGLGARTGSPWNSRPADRRLGPPGRRNPARSAGRRAGGKIEAAAPPVFCSHDFLCNLWGAGQFFLLLAARQNCRAGWRGLADLFFGLRAVGHWCDQARVLRHLWPAVRATCSSRVQFLYLLGSMSNNSEKIVALSRSPARSDYERDDVSSAAMHGMFEAKRRRQSQSKLQSPAPVRSDYDRDEIDSRNQAEGWDWLRRQRQNESDPPSPTPSEPSPPKN